MNRPPLNSPIYQHQRSSPLQIHLPLRDTTQSETMRVATATANAAPGSVNELITCCGNTVHLRLLRSESERRCCFHCGRMKTEENRGFDWRRYSCLGCSQWSKEKHGPHIYYSTVNDVTQLKALRLQLRSLHHGGANLDEGK